MEWLIARGADLNVADNDGCTAMHGAASEGDVAGMEWMLAHGAGELTGSSAPRRSQCM
jgi:ankyrin repeat protein